jgi:Uma2 family endonuclease
VAALPSPKPPQPPQAPQPDAVEGERRLVIYNVPWSHYVAVRELLDSPGLRMAYCEGTLELVSTSRHHEDKKKLIARLVEIYALECDVPLDGSGQTTFRAEAKARGLEPDECYSVVGHRGEFPDIAIEVVLTSGGIDKLDIYRGLDVREVWFWEDGRFHLHALRGDGYVDIARSELVPNLDFDQLATFVHRDDQHDSVRDYRDWLRAHAASSGR